MGDSPKAMLRLSGHEHRQTPGGSEEQGGLACCSPWGHRVRHNQLTKQKQGNLQH